MNSIKLVNKNIDEVKIVVNGAGAAGIAITKLLRKIGVENIIMCDSKGIIYEGRKEGMNRTKDEIAKVTNPNNEKGTLKTL